MRWLALALLHVCMLAGFRQRSCLAASRGSLFASPVAACSRPVMRCSLVFARQNGPTNSAIALAGGP